MLCVYSIFHITRKTGCNSSIIKNEADRTTVTERKVEQLSESFYRDRVVLSYFDDYIKSKLFGNKKGKDRTPLDNASVLSLK